MSELAGSGTSEIVETSCNDCELHGGEKNCRVVDSFREAEIPETYVTIASGLLSAGDTLMPRSQLPIDYMGDITAGERANLFTRVTRFLRETPLLENVVVTDGGLSSRKRYSIDDVVLRNYCSHAKDDPDSLEIPQVIPTKLTKRLEMERDKGQQTRAFILGDMLASWVLGRNETTGIISQISLVSPDLALRSLVVAMHKAVNSEDYSSFPHAQKRLTQLSGISSDDKEGEVILEELGELLRPDPTDQDSVNQDTSKDSDDPEKGWQDFSNCLGVDPDLFFPERGASTREAKEVCKGCVVREVCLEAALVKGEKFGIWGGLSERERRRIRRQRAIDRRESAALVD